jgi:outer membrane biosynthesis protein TonB
MLVFIISILSVSLGVALLLIGKGQKENDQTVQSTPKLDSDSPTSEAETELEQPRPDLPEENTDKINSHSDVNFLESNFEIEELYKEEPKVEAEKIEEIKEQPIEIKEVKVKEKIGKPVKKEAPVKKQQKKNTKEIKKDQKIKGAKRGRKPKPKDDILLHS